jgi:hypothetical protein
MEGDDSVVDHAGCDEGPLMDGGSAVKSLMLRMRAARLESVMTES